MHNEPFHPPSSVLIVLGAWYFVVLHVLVALGRQNSVLLIRNKIVQHHIERPASRGKNNKTEHAPQIGIVLIG